MLCFRIDDTLTKELKRLDMIAARHFELLSGFEPDLKEGMHTQARISTIGATTRIENAVLTDVQIDWLDTVLSKDGRPSAFHSNRHLIEDKLSKDRERSLEEVAGCREMLGLVYSRAKELFPLSQTTLRGLHQQLLKYHAPSAHHLGRYKVAPNSVVERNQATGEERVVLKTSDPGPLTETTMTDLVVWYNKTLPSHPWPVAVACELVFRFLACHPFQDGNGRIGRALFLLALLQCQEKHWNGLVPYLAVDRFIEQHKIEYYAVLAETSGGRFSFDPREYRIELFLHFMVRMMFAALDSITVYRERYQAIRDLSESAAMVFQCFKDLPEQRLTPMAIRQQTNLAERTVSRSLRALFNANLVQRYGKGPGTRYQLVF